MEYIKAEIQKDLDDGKFGIICSNEETFKNYVFQKLEKLNDMFVDLY